MNAARLRTIALFAMAALVVPLATAALLSWSATGRDDRIAAIPVAIVNEDRIVTGETPMAAGRALSAALVHPDDDALGLGWTLTGAEAAQEGLESGDYYAVLTIPEDFSQSVLSVGTDEPVTGALTLETNPAASAVGALAAQAVTQAATAALGAEITDAFVTRSLEGTSTIAASLTTAADGAGQLATGAAQLAEGTSSLADASGQLAAGMAQAAAGTASVSDGAAATASGTAGLSTSAGTLAGASAQLATGTQGVSTGTAGVASGAGQLSASLASLSANCRAVSSSDQFCTSLAAAAQSSATLSASASQVAAAASSAANGAQSLSSGAAQLASGSTQLASGAARLADGASQAADGVAQAADGSAGLADGATQLADAATQLASGSADLAAGLDEGAAQVPVYSEDQAETMARVVTEPLSVTTTATTSAEGWIAAIITAIVLWLGTLVTLTTGHRAYTRAALDSPASTPRLTWLLLRSRLAIAAAQAIVAVAVVGLFGFRLDAAVAVAAVALLAAIAFTLVLAGLEAAFGRWGLVGFGILTVAQVATSALLPLQTAPSGLASLHSVLPANAFASLAAGLAGNGADTDAGTALLTLVVWSALGLIGVGYGIRHRRSRTGSWAARPLAAARPVGG